MANALPTTRQVKIINKKKFAKTILDKNIKVFVVYVALPISKILIYPTWEAQIALLVIKEVAIPTKYSNYADIFLKKLAVEFPEYFDINEYLINLELGK